MYVYKFITYRIHHTPFNTPYLCSYALVINNKYTQIIFTHSCRQVLIPSGIHFDL